MSPTTFFQTLSMVLTFLVASIAAANYDRNLCEELLTKTPRIEHEYQVTIATEDYMASLGLNRNPTGFEFEALKDVMADFSIKLVFANGKTVFASEASGPKVIKELVKMMNRSSLTEVIYTPDTLARLGKILKATCYAIKLSDCETYDKYKGLTDSTQRPLSLAQERVIKWAVFYNLPPFAFRVDVRDRHKNGGPKRSVRVFC